MKVEYNMRVYHDNGCMLGELSIDPVWNKVRFKAGKVNASTGAWCQGGTMDADDLKKLAKIMSGIQSSINTDSLLTKIRKQL
jgi:hypothetical protein